MYDPKEKVKLNVSAFLKRMNKTYRRNYTVQDVANEIGVSRESLSRLTTFSAFNLVYAVVLCLYNFYPEHNDSIWNFSLYLMWLADDDYAIF